MDGLDAVVLGAGFGGLHMLYRLRQMGLNAIGLEAGSDVGGAWYWNRYPGARCDVESLVYSYSFSPEIDAEWRWSERYSGQAEIRAYMSFVADRLDLRKDIRFNSRLEKATFDGDANEWTFETSQGETFRAPLFISSAGPISAPIWPDIPERDSFKGTLYHSALWPREQEPDFTGKRVAVIGTGSSGTQIIPLVAQQAAHLTAFVRTAGLYMPANNRPLDDADYELWNERREEIRRRMRSFELVGSGDIFMDEELVQIRNRPGTDFTPEERREILDKRFVFGGATVPRAFTDVVTNQEVNEQITEYLREQPRRVIKNPKVAEILTPTDVSYGQKRVVVGTEFYESFNRDNVTAIDAKANPIERFTEKGLMVGGEEMEFDVIICASGFDALTGALTVIDIRGEGGRSIKETWSDNSDTYLGYGIAGFPNLLMIGGPGSPSVLVNVVVANEFQVDWIGDLIEYMRTNGFSRVEVDPEAQARWAQTVKDVVKGTILEGSKSWYVGANVPGKTQGILAYAGGLANYTRLCNECAEHGYEGFRFSSAS
ncbi:MAG: NAD(P)/FAD-dependent oxidoreductase [Pseudomonadota bacterium]